MPKKLRLDQLLVGKGLFPSREQARRAVMAGDVKVGTRIAVKPSELLEKEAQISIKASPKYVGRGALKLESALDYFKIDVHGKTALDIGASTGGFTDCMLQRGAEKVYAVDVGHGQLNWKLRNDSRVIVLERVNARALSRGHVPELVELCVIDVSFISLTLVLPNAFDLITPTGVILALIKPQFELQRADVGSRVRYTFRPRGDRNCSICYQRRGRQPGIFRMHPKTIGIIAHTGKPGVGDLVNAIAQELSRLSITTLLEKETARIAGKKSEYSIVELGAATDLLVVAGGDGTILRVVGQLGEAIKPIFGINVGSLGFLTTASSATYRQAVEYLAKDRINFSQRALLEARVRLGEKKTAKMLALNDAVLSRGELSRLVLLRTRVNGETLTEFNADGLIVATPTGSTAYSLSAGGPILDPESGVFVITPICPHVLTNRSIIVAEGSTIEIEASDPDYPVFLTLDGRKPIHVERESVVTIRKAKKTLPLASLPDASFFSVVRQKLKWSGSNL
jgi:TlyA family rRNA methyltransferase/putative hemolysin